MKKNVQHAARLWQQYANITFDFGTNNNTELRIGFKWKNDTTSWSYIGTDALAINQVQPTMNFGWLDADTVEKDYSPIILHEFGHSLGLIHEFLIPAGGIRWNIAAVYNFFTNPPCNWSKEEINHAVFERYSRAMTNKTRFDPRSIMLYSVADELSIEPYEIPLNSNLSESDKVLIKSIYPFHIKKEYRF